MSISVRKHIFPPSFRTLILVTGLVVALLFTPTGRRVLVPPPSKTELAIDLRLDEVRFEGTSLQDAIRSIESRAGVSISVNWNSIPYVNPNSVPHVMLRDVTVREAIAAAFESMGAEMGGDVRIQPDGPVIRVQDRRLKPISRSLRLYDIERFVDADLKAEAYPARTISMGKPTRIDVGRQTAYMANLYSGADVLLPAGGTGKLTRSDKCGWLAIEATQEQHQNLSRFLEKIDHPVELNSDYYRGAMERISQVRAAPDVLITELNIEGATLQEAVFQLQRIATANVVVPSNVPTQRKVTLRVKNVAAEQAVDMILIAASNRAPASQLHYREGNVAVVGSDYLRTRLPLIVYDVSKLIDVLAGGGDSVFGTTGARPAASSRDMQQSRDWLIGFVHAQVDPESWADRGRAGTVELLGNRLLIQQTPANHRRVATLIDMLRRAFLAPNAEKNDPGASEVESRVLEIGGHNKAAATDVDHLILNGVDITEALEIISSKSRVKFAVNIAGLKSAGVDLDRKITLAADDLTPVNAARMAFDAVSIPGTVSFSKSTDDGIVWIQTSTVAPLRIYDVRDLVWSTKGQHSVSGLDSFADAEEVAAGELQFHLMKRIRTGGTWNENGGDTGITYFGGRFFVNQNSESHTIIARYLAELRKQKSR